MSEEEFTKDPFKVLQVSRDAEEEVIEAAYRSLSRKYHPDRADEAVDQERMKEINWAYDVLKDPSKRSDWASRQKESEARAKSETKEYDDSTSRQEPPPDRQTSPHQPPPTTAYYPRQRGGGGGLSLSKIFLFLIGISILISVISSLSNSQEPSPSTVSSSSSSAKYTTPTRTTRPRPTNTPPPQCIRWNKVSSMHVGRSICVYGRIVRIYEMGQYNQIVRFTDQPGAFLLRGEYYYFKDLRRDLCIAVVGTIERSESYLFINIDDPGTQLYEYSDCY
ncbi:MAG: DnaJ domain-containing protein [Anaerolineales bacterium]|nr:DnaJ domain-containing protein [Anaerolineales bacterium]